MILQVLRRAKRQQDLIREIQKNLKVLSSIEKSIGKTTDQIKQLQVAVKNTQKEITQIQMQIVDVEQSQEKRFRRIDQLKQRARAPAISKAKVPTGNERKSSKSNRRQ